MLLFKDGAFHLISNVSEIFSDEILHLKYLDNHIYASCPSSFEIVKIAFPKLAMSSKRGSVIGRIDSAFIHKVRNNKVHKVSLKSMLGLYRKGKLDGCFNDWGQSYDEGRWNFTGLSREQPRLLRPQPANE